MIFIFLVALICRGSVGVQNPRPGPDSAVYVLSPATRLEVHTTKSGLLGFAGHDHTILARGLSGQIVYFPDHPADSRVALVITSDSLEVLTPRDTSEIRQVREAMRTHVLDVLHFPDIRFVSRTVTPTDGGLTITGDLTIVGQTREVPVNVKLWISADTLRARARLALYQTAFGITPYRGGPAGTVRVADRIEIDLDAVGIREFSR